jgi:sulfopropanediol 3-dehydrogenase
MHLNDADKAQLGDGITVIKEPPGPDAPAQRDPEVAATVSRMLSDIEGRGLAAVRKPRN